jgi:hypothetical protein
MHRKHWSLILVLGMLLSLMPQAVAAQAPNFYTSIIVSDVTSGAPVVGGSFTTDVSLSIVNNAVPTVGIMGVDLYLAFNPTRVKVNDTDGNIGNGIQVSVSTGFFGGSTIVAENIVEQPCSKGGAGACVHLVLSTTNDAVTNRTGKIATITWSGVAEGPTNIRVLTDFTVLADSEGGQVLINSTSVPAITIMPSGIIAGRVERQGVGVPNLDDTAVVAYNAGGGVIAEGWTDGHGFFELAVPQGGVYVVRAFYPGYLRAQKSNVYVVGASVDIGTTKLLGGDVNVDNNVNILDIVGIIGSFGAGGILPADINGDGIVNIFDLTIAAGNFGKAGPTAW